MGKLLEEFRRRKVFRIAGVYAVVGWVLAQVAAFAVETFAAPQWLQQMFVVFLLLGFPLALILAWAYEVTPEGVRADGSSTVVQHPTPSADRKLIYATFILVLSAVSFQIIDRFVLTKSTDVNVTAGQTTSATPIRFNLDEPIGFTGAFSDLAISRDGEKIVYLSFDLAGIEQLNIRTLSDLVTIPLRGAMNREGPSFSADGEWVAFVQHPGHTLVQKVPVSGGDLTTITELPSMMRGLSWGRDDQVIMGTQGNGLFRAPAGGGDAEALTILNSDEDELSHMWPSIVEGQDAVLFTIQTGIGNGQLAVLNLNTRDITRLGLTGVSPRYVATGHLVYATVEGSIRAVPFDTDSFTVTGSAITMVEGISVKNQGPANFDISDNGQLIYASGRAGFVGTSLVLVDREGREETLDFETQRYGSPRFSPDGGRLAAVVSTASDRDIWVFDLLRSIPTRVTFGGNNVSPVWTYSGEKLAYADNTVTTNALLLTTADGSGQKEVLLEKDSLKYPGSWTADGSLLAYEEFSADGASRNIWVLPQGGEPEPVIVSPFGDSSPAFSPNGEWLAYHSIKTDRFEVYVRPYPGPGPEVTVSTSGGNQAVWSKDGSELFYRANGQMMVVAIDTSNGIQASTPQLLFEDYYDGALGSTNYDVSPDAEKFVMLLPGARSGRGMVMVLNWFAELQERVGNN